MLGSSTVGRHDAGTYRCVYVCARMSVCECVCFAWICVRVYVCGYVCVSV